MVGPRRLVLVLTLLAASAVAPGGANPLPRQVPIPVLSYDGAGFAAFWQGRIVAVARQGTRHWDDPTGRISLYTFTKGRMDWPPATLVDTDFDDRNPSGGVTPTGSLVFFYSKSTGHGRWNGISAVRISGNERTEVSIPTWPDGSYSAYGPLVVLPSGRLMQTVYGWNRQGYRIRARFSNDDGRTWPEQRQIWFTNIAMPNETAAAFVDGATDATSRLIALSRSARWIDGEWIGYLMQHVSTNGGRTWRQVGLVGEASTRGVIPWIANIGGGRLAMVTVDRHPDTMTINVAVARAADVFSNPRRWPKARPIYRSTFMDSHPPRVGGYGPTRNYGDFGYPSIVQAGALDSQKFVVFYDSHTGDSGYEPLDMPIDTDLIMRPLFSPPID